MKARLITLALLTICWSGSFSQSLKKEYQVMVNKFINDIKKDNIENLAGRVSYPFEREYPIPCIKNKQEFIKRYNQVFDAALKQKILNSKPLSDWSDVGYHGIMLYRGDIWLNLDGNLICVNYQSKFEDRLKSKLIEAERKNIHSSLSHYQKPVCILETSDFRIRIDDLGNGNYRYASWPVNQSMAEKPSLVLDHGEFIPEGSGGNSSYNFKNGVYIYNCFINAMFEEGPPALLSVYKGDKMILSQDARNIKK